MNSEEKIDKLYNDMTEVKVTLARMEGCLHTAPCRHLCEHITKQSSDVSSLHQKIEKHKDDHHSPKSSRANWAVIAAIVCALATLIGVFYKG